MDNISHTLIGLVAGDAIHNATNPRKMSSVERRRLFLLSSAIANNLPDGDLVLSGLLPPPVGYLLHHRGITHTFIFALPQALIVVGLLYLLRGSILSKRLTKTDWLLAFVTALIGAGLHVVADGWNSYGTHPFYPFDNSWIYGDMMFIIEPILWMIGGAWILLELPLLWRMFFFSLFSLIIGYGYSLGAMAPVHIGALFGLVSLLTLLMGLLSGANRSSMAIVLIVLLLGVFKYQSHSVKKIIYQEYASRGLPRIEDVALTPLPMNPFCWNALVANVESGEFAIRKGLVNLWPEKVKAKYCDWFNGKGETVTKVSHTANITWNREYRTKLASFVESSDCYLKAWLGFARMPQIINGSAVDVRFSNRGISNFTEMPLRPGRECLTGVPPWIAPRSFLLSEKL